MTESGRMRALNVEVSEHARALREAVEHHARPMLRELVAAIGLVPHSSDLVEQQNQLQSSSVLALYVPSKKKILPLEVTAKTFFSSRPTTSTK